MLDTAFVYNYDNKAWEQCTDNKYINTEIEDIPCITLVEYMGYLPDYGRELNHNYVFCHNHNAMEEIASISAGCVISTNGCCLEGIVGKAAIEFDYYGRYVPVFVPYRWRIFQRSPSKTTNIACDVMKVQYCRNGILRKWCNFALTVDIIKNKVVISKVKKANDEWIYWNDTDIEVPAIVVDTAINALRESTCYVTGIKPSVLCQIKGFNTIMAYIERPFDLNVVFLKRFLNFFYIEDDVFDKMFPYDEKDNYKKICNLLGIRPPKSLRKAYSFNPYAIVWYMIFKQWGIKDINYMHKFFYLDDCIANMFLCKFHYDSDEKRVTRCYDDSLFRWEAVEFYCHWLLENKGEKRMLKWLYEVSAKNGLSSMQWDIILSFHDYHNELSEEVKKRLLRDGLTAYVHDAISTEVTALSERLENIKIKYKKFERAYACKINDYKFKLVPNTRMLSKIGAAFNNCVASYRNRVLDHSSVIVYVMNKKEYVACIEIKKGRHIVQALGKYNGRLDSETNRICFFWAKLNNLVDDVGDLSPLSPEELKEFDDAVIEKIPYEKSVDEMTIDELVNLDIDKMEKGYFMRLGELINNSAKYPLSAPHWIDFPDEESRLTYLIPEGNRLFMAASYGNGEALMALGYLYLKGKAIKRDYEKALKCFEMADDWGGLQEAKKEIQRVKYLMNHDLSERDSAILDAITNLHRRVINGEIG